MSQARWMLVVIYSLGLAVGVRAGNESGFDPSQMRTYPVDRLVSDFPEGEDLSTPESAYAYISRQVAKGDQAFWKRISIDKIATHLPDLPPQPVSPEAAEARRNAKILQVHIYRDRYAMVLAQPVGWNKIDSRLLKHVDDHWLNVGNDYFTDLAQSRERFAVFCAASEDVLVRPAIDDPQAHLQTFIEFLKNHGEQPHEFVLKALADHHLVIMGEIHHRPRYWAFNSELVSDPRFAHRVGVIYMELPSNHRQDLRAFVDAAELDTAPVIATLRDMLWTGWPDKPMLDFLVAVWRVNQSLPAERRLRVVPVDVPRPWSELQQRSDWQQYETDRDTLMAENILADLAEHGDNSRGAMFIVGEGHAMLDLMQPGRMAPVCSAGWYLRQKLGDDVYALVPHGPSETNVGQVHGRRALGLFDAAFQANGQRPVAFPLNTGPFGQQPFDAMPDKPISASSAYGDGFSAYLYLGPLEDEVFSPLIEGFYTDEFAQELDRRCRVTFGKGWGEAYRQPVTGEAFAAWMSHDWDQPRRSWSVQSLGPIDAWHYGDNWEQAIASQQYAAVRENPELILAAAQRLLEAIRDADYDAFLADAGADRSMVSWEDFPAPDVYYQVHSDYPGFVLWCCRRFKADPITNIKLGEVSFNDQGRPMVPYVLTLKSGATLNGNLPFVFQARSGQWLGTEGLDWHRK